MQSAFSERGENKYTKSEEVYGDIQTLTDRAPHSFGGDDHVKNKKKNERATAHARALGRASPENEDNKMLLKTRAVRSYICSGPFPRKRSTLMASLSFSGASSLQLFT